LAASDPDNPIWQEASPGIAEQVVLLPPDEAIPWLANLEPVGRRLAPHLRKIFTRRSSGDQEDSQRTYGSALGLARFLHQDTADLAGLVIDHARHAPEFHCLLEPLVAARATSLIKVRSLAQERLDRAKSNDGPAGAPPDEGLPLAERIANATLVELML